MTEQTPQPEQQPAAWGAPVPERAQQQRWSWKKSAVAGVVALGIAAGGGFAVYAASDATADNAGGRSGGPGGMGGPGGGRGGMGGAGGVAGALHGEFTVSEGDGKYGTRLLQTGEVTEISDTSVTAKSTDGYTKTYTIDSATVRQSVEQGDTVTIIATESGDTATATTISERGAGGPGMGQGGMGGQQQGVPPRREDGTAPEGAPPTE
ncbi:hypothetical protein [Actinokineospora globicatena]|uniref:DUF5666 domain-containing protein n=1 Tax=Actinokineospora globicatena TaxID=103729 RepID=A0A9W6VDA7_9PSEU|nr:hypothetical protein [Actinokineospora globicatena]GLW95076.1 hypothetical protein Aglo03_58920 [Actinokineospora globicatena]